MALSSNTYTWGGQPVRGDLNAVAPKERGGIPSTFVGPYTAAVNRVARAQLAIPNDIADSLLAELYPGGIVNAAQDVDMFATYFTEKTHAWMVDMLLDAALSWVQARYEAPRFGQTRLMVPGRWADRIYPQVDESVRRIYRRDANLMLVCDSVGSFYGLHVLAQNTNRETDLLSNAANQNLFTTQVNSMADVLAAVYQRLRQQGMLA